MPAPIGIPTTMMLVTGITLTMIVAGVMRLRAAEGFVHAVGVVVAAMLVLANHPLIGLREMRQNPTSYVAPVVFGLSALLVSAGWAYYLTGDNSDTWKKLRKENQDKTTRLLKMQESARSFSEMAASLNASLNY